MAQFYIPSVTIPKVGDFDIRQSEQYKLNMKTIAETSAKLQQLTTPPAIDVVGIKTHTEAITDLPEYQGNLKKIHESGANIMSIAHPTKDSAEE